MTSLDLAAVEALAEELHEGQTRRHGRPYIEHPRAVRTLAEDLGGAMGLAIDDVTRAACVLHDVLEDCDIDEGALARRFGVEVARRVRLLTKPERRAQESKRAHSARYFKALGHEADDALRLVKVADRLHNLSELHLDPDRERAALYLEETRSLVLPLARDARAPHLACGLEAALLDAMALAARLQGIDVPERALGEGRVPSGLYAILDVGPTSTVEDIVALTRAVVQGGAALLQLRCKNVDDKTALAFVEAVLPVASATGLPVIVNDRADLAHAANTGGVHLGQNDLPPARMRPLLPAHMLIGASSHTVEEARASASSGCVDYVAFGPVYPSPTKQGHADVTGLSALEHVVGAMPVPVVAIGGITSPQRMAEISRAGARLGAVISALSSAPEPRFMARRLSLAHATARGGLP